MRYLGIDYGTKNIGLAVSDEAGQFAFPLLVVKNDAQLLATLKELIRKEGVQSLVIGESKNFQGVDNPLMAETKKFAERLSAETSLPIFFEPEFLTSREAERVPGGKDEEVDARAAAIILRSYLEKQN